MRRILTLGALLMLASFAYSDEPTKGSDANRDHRREQKNALSHEERKDGFTLLFNGKDLDGWRGDLKHYEVKDGAIVCRGENIYTKNEYGDFILRFEFKLPPGGNNGVGIRTPDQGDAAYVGMEIQILDDGHPNHKNLAPYQLHGSIYGVVAAKGCKLRPVGAWNDEEIVAKGSRIKVTVNGRVVVDADLRSIGQTPDGKEHPGLRSASGHLGFLGHGNPVEFRSVRVKDCTRASGGARRS